ASKKAETSSSSITGASPCMAATSRACETTIPTRSALRSPVEARGGNVFFAMDEDEISSVRAVKRAASGAVALARRVQDSAITIFDFDRGFVADGRFHPAIERKIGRREKRFRIVCCLNLGAQSFDAFGARGSECNAKLRYLVFGRIQPACVSDA